MKKTIRKIIWFVLQRIEDFINILLGVVYFFPDTLWGEWLKPFFARVVRTASGLKTKTTGAMLKPIAMFALVFARVKNLDRRVQVTISAVAVAGIAAIVFFTYDSAPEAQAMSVSVNGQVIGYVENETEFASIAQMAKEKISADNSGTAVLIPEETIALADARISESGAEEKAVDENTLAEEILAQDNVRANVYNLVVNDETIATFATLKEASDVLNTLIASFETPDTTTPGAFQETVTIITEEKPFEDLNFSNPDDVITYLLTGGVELKEYTIQDGDTLWALSMDLDYSLDEIYAANPDKDLANSLHPGDVIQLTRAVPVLHYETSGLEVTREPIAFETEEEKTDEMYMGEKEVKVPGVEGEREVTRDVTRINGIVQSSEEVNSVTIIEPITQVMLVGSKPKVSAIATGDAGTGVLGRPLSGWRFSRGVGGSHKGDDLLAPSGSPIFASEAGTVVYAGWESGYGNIVKIDHGAGIQTWYAHCSEMYVGVGASVFRGQTIAAVGMTGRAYAYHLHFEVRVNGSPVEPMNYIG